MEKSTEGVRLNVELWDSILQGLPFETRRSVKETCRAWNHSSTDLKDAYIRERMKKKRDKKPFLDDQRKRSMLSETLRKTVEGLGWIECNNSLHHVQAKIVCANGSSYFYTALKGGHEEEEQGVRVEYKSDRIEFSNWYDGDSKIDLYIDGEKNVLETGWDLFCYKICGFYILIPKMKGDGRHTGMVNEDMRQIHEILEISRDSDNISIFSAIDQ